MEAAATPVEETILSAAARAANDPSLVPQLENLQARVQLSGDPTGMRGGRAFELAPKFGAHVHELVVVIARLTGRELVQVAAEAQQHAAARPTEQPSSEREQRDRRREARRRLESVDPPKPTGQLQLDELVRRSPGGFIARTLARLLEPKVGSRDPAVLRDWERAEFVDGGWDRELVDQALALLAAVRSRPGVREEWSRWLKSLEPPPARHASAPAGPPEVRARFRGEHSLGELRRRLLAAEQIPAPGRTARQLPVMRGAGGERNPDTGLYEFETMLGTVRCSFKPTLRYARYYLALALLFREADHVENPAGDGRRTVITSFNALGVAAYGRDAWGEEYDSWEAFLCDMVDGFYEATDRGAEKHKQDYSAKGTPLEAAHILLADGEVMALRDWRQLSAEERGRRGRGGSSPSLMLTFTEEFRTAVMTREQHFLVDKQAAWRIRAALPLLVLVESHTGINRGQFTKEWWGAPPFLRQLGLHGPDQRANELALEEDLKELQEACPWVDYAGIGDSKNGTEVAWVTIAVNRRAPKDHDCEGRRRVRTRRERREAWPQERPGRIGRRRTFAPLGTPGRARERDERAASKLLGQPVKYRSRRRRSSRARKRTQKDIAAAAAVTRAGP